MIDRIFNNIVFNRDPNNVYNVDFIKKYLTSGRNDELLNQRRVTGANTPTNITPKIFNASNKFRFKRIFDNNKWTVENNELIYNHDGNKRFVVPREDVEDTLQDLYQSNLFIGIGQNALYKKISEKVIGIRRKEASEFLKKQSLYQLTNDTHHVINKPLRPKEKLQQIHLDLVDFARYSAQNRQYKYVLSFIDGFTKKCFLRGLKHKTLEDTIEALDNIIQESGKPRKIISDLGGEFSLDAWGRQNNVIIIHSRSYQPETNGQVENLNRQIRKILRAFFVRNNSTNWIDNLQEVQDNLNSNRHSVTKQTPNSLFETNNEGNKLKARLRIDERAKKILSKEKDYFRVGDLVRIKMSALKSKVRKMIKDKDKKFIIVTYTPEVYRIYQIIRNNNIGFENTRYLVKHLDGRVLIAENLRDRNNNLEPREKLLFGSDLIHSQVDDTPLISSKDADKLNSVETIPERNAPVNPPGNNPAPAPRNVVVHQVAYEPRPVRNRQPNQQIYNPDYVV